MNKNIQIIIAIIAIVLIGGAFYVSSRNQKSDKKVVTSPEVVDTTDWKMYSNEKLGLQFDIPSDWKIQDSSLILSPDAQISTGEKSNGLVSGSEIEIMHNGGMPQINKADKEVVINGVKGYVSNGGDIRTGSLGTNIIIPQKDGYIVIAYSYSTSTKGDEIVSKILSTFKFTTSTPTLILSPNGGETYKLGEALDIKWAAGTSPFEIMVETYSQGELVVSGWIATNVNPITAKYTWRIGDIYNTDAQGQKVLSTLSPGKYFIRLSDFKTGALSRSKALFTITK